MGVISIDLKKKIKSFGIIFLIGLIVGVILGMADTANIISPEVSVIISMVLIVLLFVLIVLFGDFSVGVHAAAVFLVGLGLGVIAADYIIMVSSSLLFHAIVSIYGM